MTDLLDNPPESVRDPLRRAVRFYRSRRNHPNWLQDQWAEDRQYGPLDTYPRYVDQLTFYATGLFAMELHERGHAIPEIPMLLVLAGRQLLLSELTEAEQATVRIPD